MAEACYGEIWREILDAPAISGVLAFRAAGLGLLRYWGMCEPQRVGAALQCPPAFIARPVTAERIEYRQIFELYADIYDGDAVQWTRWKMLSTIRGKSAQETR
ncbi:hypothetical protein FA95DRAFT_1614353 [Auriscalpium vulgare]|uniref:Uncharacterized protein n=1 Tax=Auriscalpium vulgare TaxID=40419 RepID=A0ACB8QZK1_9AGAM|nr:hypothetical protein FA95DRAFT_1614353 [Auriscalpium vulgare]